MTAPVILQVLVGQASGELFWDSTNNNLGIGTNTPRYPIDVIDNDDYGAKAIITCAAAGTSAYANWGASNGTAGCVFGMAGANYNVVPALQNRGYVYAYSGNGLAVVTANNQPVVFGTNNAETGRWNEYGGLNFTALTGSPTHKNGDFWFDGSNFKAQVGGVIKTVTLT